MAVGLFSKNISDWVSQTVERIDAVHARSFELLGEELAKTKGEGGKLPFLTGNLARSLLASKQGMPNVADGPFAGSNIGLVAATLKANETVFVGYQAKYSFRQNYGYVGADSLGRVYNQQGHYFVEGAVAKWPEIVKAAVTDIKSSS